MIPEDFQIFGWAIGILESAIESSCDEWTNSLGSIESMKMVVFAMLVVSFD